VILFAAGILAVALAVTIGLSVFERFAGEHPIADTAYDVWLRRQDLAALDRAAAENPRRANVIVTLTTLPSRIERIDQTLRSLLHQTVSPAAIRLNVPRTSRREGVAYQVPERLRALRLVTIAACDDFGPATKLIPSLLDAAGDARLLVVDDDRIYQPYLIEQMAGLSDRHPDVAIAASGWNAPPDLVDRPSTLLATLQGRPPAPIKCTRVADAVDVDVMQGLGGYLVRPGFFDVAALADYSTAPDAAFYVDDVWIGAHCRARKVVFKARRTNFASLFERRFYKRSSVALVNRGTGTLESRNNTIMLRYFADRWRRRER
jgi:glycosyltransferase involved in cell wall biosynthesis